MPKNISKYQAEQILKLSGSYNYKDFVKAYRKSVMENHPDAGGREEDMIKINAAKDVLVPLFSDDKNIVITCSENPAKAYNDNSNHSSASAAVSRSNTQSSSYPYYDEIDLSKASSPDNTFVGVPYTEEQIKADKERGFRYNPYTQSYETFSSSDFYTNDFDPASHNSYDPSSYEAYEKTNTNTNPETRYSAYATGEDVDDIASTSHTDASGLFSKITGSYWKRPDMPQAPLWWRIPNFIVSHFPWRLTLWAIVIIYAMLMMDGSLGNITLDMSANWMVWLGAAIINTLFGIITNPIRALIRYIIDNSLDKWAENNNRRIIWD